VLISGGKGGGWVNNKKRLGPISLEHQEGGGGPPAPSIRKKNTLSLTPPEVCDSLLEAITKTIRLKLRPLRKRSDGARVARGHDNPPPGAFEAGARQSLLRFPTLRMRFQEDEGERSLRTALEKASGRFPRM